MSDKFCKSCQHWIHRYVSCDGLFGTCEHPLVEDKVILDALQEEGVIHTHELFGCIYHVPMHGTVVTKL
jgi:hypothetical protein